MDYQVSAALVQVEKQWCKQACLHVCLAPLHPPCLIPSCPGPCSSHTASLLLLLAGDAAVTLVLSFTDITRHHDHGLLWHQSVCVFCTLCLPADYIGCMKTGGIVTNQQQRWYEPQHVVLGSSTYFTHAWGSIYVVSGQVAYDIARIRQGRLRYLANEGGWSCKA